MSKAFRSAKQTLDQLTADTIATLIAASADIALVIDRKGIIVDLSLGGSDLPPEVGDHWLGKPWLETVALDSRPKVEALLEDAARGEAPRWRHVNHLTRDGRNIPVRYCTVRLRKEGNIVAVGRDLQAIANLQQRLVDAQQSVERDYWSLRQLETRYRFLFQTASEAVLIVDAGNQKILEANPVAEKLLGAQGKRVVGRPLADAFAKESAAPVHDFLAEVRAAGRAEDIQAKLPDSRRLAVRAALLRQESGSLLLVRLHPVDRTEADSSLSETKRQLASIVESAPDGIVVTGQDGRIVSANAAFLELAQLAGEDEAKGETLDQWLGRPGVDLNVLIANVRQHGSVRLFSTSVQGNYGTVTDVEISAVAIRSEDRMRFGFVIRDVGPRLATDNQTMQALPRSVEQLKDLVGRVPLKELVRESTDLIEKLCIEAALDLTDDNRASAAELLGLSRQSLYVKLRRYGLGDLGPDTEA
ncbi:MAG: transcriptional regulator PpsR [Gammaproteobacteria bacterium]|nr:transcriptional regulator PpsR [Gammaproteobacteria bacterium]